MATTDTSESSELFGGLIEMPQQQVIQIALFGAVLGVAAWVLALLVRQVILVPLFCGDPASGACVSATGTATTIAGLLTGIIGLLGLVRLSVYRPLLIVLAAVIALWGIGAWTAQLPWYEALSWSVILYALTYLAFSWLVRPRLFAPAVILVVVAVALIRWLPLL